MLVHSLDGGLAAQAATRRSEHVSRELLEVQNDLWRKKNVKDVADRVTRIGLDFRNVLSRFNEPLAEQEASGELIVMAGRAHRHAHGARVDLDFQRFFRRELVPL